ncbi:MAG: hypothetical protein AAFR26_00730 [Cyanobacteria bacterium J06626_4]
MMRSEDLNSDNSSLKLERYQAKTVQVDRRRVYEINGHQYPGVTTVLSVTKPAEARKALQAWRQRVGVETAQAISNKASSAGTRLHKQIATYLRDEPIAIAPDLSGYWQSIEPLLNQVEEALLVEGAVWHEQGYAGFPDAVVVYQGRVCVCDWKTAIRPKKLEWITDYFLQVAAYATAIEQVYQATGIQIEGALIAIALDDSPAQTFWLSNTDITDYWQQFRQRLAEYYTIRPRQF